MVETPRRRTTLAATILALGLAACGSDGWTTGLPTDAPTPFATGAAFDSLLFPGPTVEPVDAYVARTNDVQSVAAPVPEGDWDGNGWVFVANEVGRGVAVYDLRTLEPVEFIYSPDSPVPHHPYLSPDQRWVTADARFGNESFVIDTHNDFETTFLEFPEAADGEEVAGPLHGTYTSDSRYFLVALQRSDRLGVVDFSSGTPEIAEVIDLGDRPRDVYITPDDRRAFVTMQGENHVAVVDIGSWDVRTIQRSEADYSDAGGGGGGMSVDGELFAVSNTPDNEVVIIDTASEEVVHRIQDVPAPVNAEFLGDTHRVGTGNRSDGSFTFIDADRGELLETVETGGGANIPYLGPDGDIWVSHNGAQHISVLDWDTFEIETEIETGLNPHWIHFLPSNSRALVTNWGENSVSVIDTVNRTEIDRIFTGLNPNGIVVKTDITEEQRFEALEGKDEARRDIVLASQMVLPEPATQQEATFLNNCTVCHDLGRIVRNNAKTEEDWTAIVERMRGNGAQIDDEQFDSIVDYLASGRHQDLEFGTMYDDRHGGDDAESDDDAQ